MISNHCHRVGRVLLLLGCCLTLRAEADIASLFTNLNGTRPAGVPRRASIIVIQADSVGYLDLSCYGQKKFATPNLDRLAAGGMLFTNFDAGGASGAEARAAFLLGHDAVAGSIPDDMRTVAQILHSSGYHTGYLGEWNFGGQGSGSAPWDKGFDEFAGYFTPEDAENYYADFWWRYAPKAIYNTNYNRLDTYVGREPIVANLRGQQGRYIPDIYSTAASQFIVNNAPDPAHHYRPFFLWVNYPTPRPNQHEADRTGNGLQVPTDAPYSDEAWPQAEKSKAAMIARLDEGVGKILDQLRAHGMSNNVAIFFSSATLPRKVGGLDPTFFPSVVATNDLRLPMIAFWPKHIPAGRVGGWHWSPGNFLATAAQIAMTTYPTNEVAPSVLRGLYGESRTNAPDKN